MSDGFGTGGNPSPVSALDNRLAIAALFSPQTSTLAIRTGALLAPGSDAIVTGTAATNPMTYAIAAHHWVTQRASSDGAYVGSLEAATTVTTTTAPGSNSRIDIIWSKQQDTAASTSISPDGVQGPLYGVTQGTAAVSPVAPTIPVGAAEIGRAIVAAGATSTGGAGVTITASGPQVVARGAPVPVKNQAERDALTRYKGLMVFRIDTGNLELNTNGLLAGWVVFTTAASLASALAAPTPTAFPGVTNWGLVSGYTRPGYYKDASGIVHGSGAIQWNGATVGPGTVMNTALPVGFRPSSTLPLQIMASSGTGALRVDMSTGGVLSVVSNLAAGTVFFLDSLIFNPNTLTVAP